MSILPFKHEEDVLTIKFINGEEAEFTGKKAHYLYKEIESFDPRERSPIMKMYLSDVSPDIVSINLNNILSCFFKEAHPHVKENVR